MVTCSVIDCCTTQRYNPEKCTFHRFPSNLDTRNIWLRIINRSNWTPKKNSCICSKHFDEKYFLMRGAKRILMKSAIPSNFVPVKIKPKRTVTSYVHRDIIPEPIACITSSSNLRPPLSISQPPPSTSFELEVSPREKKLISICAKLHEKIKMQRKLIRNLRAQNKRLKSGANTNSRPNKISGSTTFHIRVIKTI